LEVWTDQNPPPGDSPLNQSGYLWEHPSAGRLYYDPKTKQHVQVGDDWWEANAALPPQAAAEQAAAVETAPAPGAAEPATGGQGATEAIRARFTSGQARAAEQARAGTESAVQAAAAEQRRREADPYFGIDMGERGEVALLMKETGLDELSAIEEFKKRRAAAEAGALEQAEAIEAAEVPPQ
jgi:hypothetical protein